MDGRLKKNDIIELKIQDMGSEGEGIGRYEGFTFFVKGALPGDEILAKVMKLKKNYGYARMERIVVTSQDRVEPVCELFGRCGGCQLQHLAYPKQLEYKQKKVKDCLRRIAKIENPPLEEPVGMENPYYYRNKAQFPVGRKTDGSAAIGFFAGHSHTIVDMNHCYIQEPINHVILQSVRLFLDEFKVSIYDETLHQGLLRHFLTRVGFITGEVMVCLVLNGNEFPYIERFVERLRLVLAEQTERAYTLASVCVNVNTERTNVILGSEVLVCFGRPFIFDLIGEVKFRISPLSFFQVNPLQTRRLYDAVLEFADLHGNEVVWDLYCGIGTISLYLAAHAARVFGVEIVPQAIEDARENAVLNGVSNAEFFVGAAEIVLPQMLSGQKEISADVVILDPPRKGCDYALLETVCLLLPEKIVYVSCDPATLARDVAWLSEKGYQMKRGKVFDQFGQSGHVETVVLLSLKTGTPKLEVTMEVDSDSNYSPEEKATYQKIKEYVKNKYGVNVHTRYIAEVKRMCGIDMGENYNKSKKDEPDVKHCPQEKVEYIKEALKYFRVL